MSWPQRDRPEEPIPVGRESGWVRSVSTDTGNAERDTTLRSAKFFDAESFPVIAFRSRRIERSGENAYRVVGDLTMRDVTKEITLDAEFGGFITDLRGARRAGFAIRGNVERSAFGMTWNQLLEAGGVAISDSVAMHAEFEAVARSAQAA